MRGGFLNTGASLIAGVLLCMCAASAQDPVLKVRPRNRDATLNGAHRVTINVQVTDASGNPVPRLRDEDFALYDNRQPRRITAFHPIDGTALNDATEVLILLDAVNTPADALRQGREAIFRYLAESHKPLPFPTAFALWFNGKLTNTPPTTDRDEIGRAFVKLTKNIQSNDCGVEQPAVQRKVPAKSSPATPANCRAVHFKDSLSALNSIAQQQLTSGGRTLLIWIGAGWPVLPDSELGHLQPKQRDAYAQEFRTLMHNLRAAQITLYSIAAGNAGASPAAASPDPLVSPSAEDPLLPSVTVAEFAQRTGGRAIHSSADITADLHACIRDAEWYYSLSFNAPPAQNGAEETHSLEVKVNRPGLDVRTVSSYYVVPQ